MKVGKAIVFLTFLVCLWGGGVFGELSGPIVVDDFDRPDSLYHGHKWESLNPGYWKVENKALRRRLRNRGDWVQEVEFPFRTLLEKDSTYSIRSQTLPLDYPPSLPFGMIWRRDWELGGNYVICLEAEIKALPPLPEETEKSKEYAPEYSLVGICFGGRSLLESWKGGAGSNGYAAWMALWRAGGRFGIYTHATDDPSTAQPGSEKPSVNLKVDDKISIRLAVTGDDEDKCTVTASLEAHNTSTVIRCENVDRRKFTDGYFGIVGRGLLDFAVERLTLIPFDNKPIDAPVNDLRVCYALGDTLKKAGGGWRCRFITMFHSDGQSVEIRIADSPSPKGGWDAVAAAGAAAIVTNDFRLNTASIDVTLPFDPAETTMYYTVWKDGVDVTADVRTGRPGGKDYVGRLPRLKAPYKIAGLGGHSIHGYADMPGIERFEKNWVRGQPTPDAFKYFEDYNFQICNWEDDVWYLELLLFPASVDDAYKIINITIANPTFRRLMMRHWNTINPGDHDYGMNDLRGPEQYVIRRHGDLGQDPEYMRRNYQIVRHLISGDENPSATENAKYWRRWKMPDGDFTFLILDARSWRDSTDTALWVKYGWGHNETVYDRRAPMRTLLGEEQFAWLQEIIRTDSSPLICITGINGLHTIWQGSGSYEPATGLNFNQRGRGSGDFAGWAKAGSDRVIELFGTRPGIVTIYGDVHCASIMQNLKHRFYECSFGPIARNNSRGVKKGFGPLMSDYDLRCLQVFALYHKKYASPDLKPNEGPSHWNFLEAEFDPRPDEPAFTLKIRNIIDPPAKEHRGGGFVTEKASNTGRPNTCKLPEISTIPNADVLFTTAGGTPIRGTRSDAKGRVMVAGLTEIDGQDIAAGRPVIVTAFDGKRAESQIVYTLPIEDGSLQEFRNRIRKMEIQAEEEYQGWVKEHQERMSKERK